MVRSLMAFELEKALEIEKYRINKLGEKEMHKLWEIYLSETHRFGKIGTRSWQGLFRVSSNTRNFVITGYQNEWREPGSKFRLPFIPDNRLVAILPMTRNLGWFWIDGLKGHQIDFPRGKSQKVEAPDGFLRKLRSEDEIFVEVRNDKLYIEWPAAKGLLAREKQGQALADFCVEIMKTFSDTFVIG
ncbi:MAG: hypothetical protein V4760_10130 [Bdellovibrionota bacterium]